MQNLQRVIISLLLTFLFVNSGISQQWQLKAPMPTARKGMAVAVLDNNIWVIGGSQIRHTVLSTVEVYDPDTDTWNTDFPALNVARENATAQVWNGKIYVFGGRQDHNVIADVEVYDPDQGSWQIIGQMPNPRFGMASVVVDTAIWLIGGTGGAGMNSDQVSIYYPQSNRWETLSARLNFPRGAPMAARISGKILVFGGIYFGPLKNYEIFDPQTQNWQVGGEMIYGCGSAGFAVNGNQVWIIGGIGQSGLLKKVQIGYWQGDTTLWREAPNLNVGRRELVAAIVNNRLYVIGGQGEGGMGGAISNTTEVLDVVTGISAVPRVLPSTQVLIKNFPNPFNGETVIQIGMPERDEVELKIYDALGREMVRLYKGTLVAGEHQFRFDANFAGIQFPSGIYFIRLKGKKFSASQRIHLIK